MNEISTSAAKSNQALLEAFLRYIDVDLRSRTSVSYRQIVGDFVQGLDGFDCREASPALIRAYFTSKLAKGCSPSSLFVYNCALRKFYQFLGLAQVIRKLPKIEPMKQVKRIPEALTEEKVAELIEAAESLRDRALLEVLYGTGLRASEAANLKLADINGAEREIMVRDGKGGKDRVVPFGSKADAAVKAYLASYPHETEYVFERRRSKGSLCLRGQTWWGEYHAYKVPVPKSIRIGTKTEFPTRELAQQQLSRILASTPDYKPRPAGRMTARQVHHIVADAGRRIGLRVYPHILRHSVASHMLSRCHDLRIVQELLGHAFVSTTQIYTHVSPDDLKATHAKCHPHGGEL
jgi:integrase/recombinase XerD